MTFLHRVLATQQIYYHGTPKEAAAKGILEDGSIKAPDLLGKKAKMTPVKDKVYLTRDLDYAVIYLLGGIWMGTEVPKTRMYDSQFGYLFLIHSSDLKDIQPDEDVIGEALHDAINKKLSSYEWLITLAKQKLTPKQYRDCQNGEYAAWAQSGKKLVKFLSKEQKKQLIAAFPHVAHAGDVKPYECWKFDKSKSKDLKRDCSNFFSLAEKVTSID